MKKDLFRKAMSGLLGLGMAATLTLAGGAPVMAAEGDVTRSFNKVYEWEKAYTDAEGYGSPAETFTFGTDNGDTIVANTATLESVSQSSYTQISAVPSGVQSITIGSAAYSANEAGSSTATKSVSFTLPDASAYGAPGHYTYVFQEIPGNTAGVEYNADRYQLVVVVKYNDSNALEFESVKLHRERDTAKGVNIGNKYQSGKLTITKKVTGTMGDRNKTFPVVVTLTKPEGRTVKSTIHVAGTELPSNVTVADIAPSDWGTATTITRTFQVKNDTSIVLSNIPAGVSYTVEEDRTNNTDYTTTYKKDTTEDYTAGATVAVTKMTNDTIVITNDKGGQEDTGLFLSNLPYILVIAAIGAGAVVYAVVKIRKRNA